MAVFREIEVEFDGKAYTFTPSNKLMRRIDAGLHPLTLLGVVGTMDGANVPLPSIAYIISEFIQAGGGDSTEDDVIAALYDDLATNNGNGIGPLVQAIGACIAPPDDAVKNSPAPAVRRGKKQKKG